MTERTCASGAGLDHPPWDGRGGTLSTLIIAAGPVAGAVIGYELSHSLNQPESSPEYASAHSGLRVAPVVSITPTGGILGGLVGRF